jgi:hypothetical protein
MRSIAAAMVCAACLGCAAAGPTRVFEESTAAFARGDAEEGTRYFSARLAAARPLRTLDAYYRDPENRKGVEYLRKDHRVRMLEENDACAVAEVTWTTGRAEKVYFVREGGEWKIDLPPSPSTSAGTPAPPSPSAGKTAEPSPEPPSAPKGAAPDDSADEPPSAPGARP